MNKTVKRSTSIEDRQHFLLLEHFRYLFGNSLTVRSTVRLSFRSEMVGVLEEKGLNDKYCNGWHNQCFRTYSFVDFGLVTMINDFA